MKRKFVVDIVASVSKEITVKADSEEEAKEQAHEIFAEYWRGLEGVPEVFEQDTYDIGEV
tara:strand:- start:273 stop:452 length:180 start_codon:yes stop_codon:yes gene_type:complete